MTSCLQIIGQAKATQVGRKLKVTHQEAAPNRGKVWLVTLLALKSHITGHSFPLKSGGEWRKNKDSGWFP